MRINTLSVVVGDSACDAACKFCVSKTTGFDELPCRAEINRMAFSKACKFARLGQCSTVLLTGKGEPTLRPEEITSYLQLLNSRNFMDVGTAHAGDCPFPFIELQTNAIHIGQFAAKHGTTPISELDEMMNGSHADSGVAADIRLFRAMDEWRYYGLNTIAISTVGINPVHNKEVYLHHRDIDYPDLATTVKFLRQFGFTIRLCVMMHKGMVDNEVELKKVIDWCRDNDVAQLTVRSISKPAMGAVGSTDYLIYISENGLDSTQRESIHSYLTLEGTHIHTLQFGSTYAPVFDVDGQNVCLSDCLTMSPDSDDIRTLIYYSSGRLTYSWQYKGARLL